MAKETERFEDTRQLSGTYYPYHSLIKYEFLDDSMFSEEENYSFIANINEDAVKETMPFERIFEDSRFDNLHDIYQTTPGELSPISNYTVDSDSCDKMLSFHISNPWTVCDESNASPTICSTKDNSSDKENNEVCHLQNDEDNLTHRSNSRKVSFDEVFEYLKGKTGTEESHNDYDNNGNKKASDSFESSLIDSNGHLGIDLKYNNTGHERKKIRVKSKSKKGKGKDCIQDNRENFKPNILRDRSKSKISSEKIPKNASNSLNDNTNNSYGRIIPESECNMMHQEVLEESIVHEEFIYQNITLSAGESLETYDQSIQISQFGSDNPVQTEVPLLKEAENGKSVENMLSTVIPALQYFDKTNDITQKEIEKCVDSTVQIDNVENMLNTEIPALHYFDKINDTRLKEIEKCVDSTVQMDDVENMLNTEIPSVQYFDKINDTSFKEIEKCLDNTVQIDNVENMLNTEIPAFQYFDKINDTSLIEIEKCLDNTVQFDDVLLKKNPSLIRNIKSGEPIKSPETKIENSNLTNTSSMTIPKLTVSIKTSKLKQVIECKARNKKGKKIMRKLFKCDICGKMFNMFKSWHNHLSIHSIPCNFCKMRFYEFNTYVTHVHETHAILPRVIVTKFKVEDFQFFVCESMQSAKSTCVLCKKVFSTRENCTNHIMECHSYDVFEWKDKGVIKKHINPLFLKKFAFALNCPVCKLYFDRESDFHSHMQSYHNSHSYCMKCNMYIFNSRLQLHKRKHLREEEQWTKVNIEYSCDCCEMSWSNPKDFGQHLNLVKCSYCANAAFCSSKALTRHLVEEHSDKLCGVCTFCDNGFCSAQDLLEHMLLTHCYGYFNSKLLTCRICSASSSISLRYYTPQSIRSHMLSHCILSNFFNGFTSVDHSPYFDLTHGTAKPLPFQCILCRDNFSFPDWFIDFQSFIYHLSEYHTNDLVGFCTSCVSLHHSENALLHGITENFISSGSKLVCTECGTSYDRPESALRHMLSLHYILIGQIPSHLHHLLNNYLQNPRDVCAKLNNSCFRCDLCNSDIDGLLAYTAHLNIKHNIFLIQLTCNLCKTIHSSLSSFVNHVCPRRTCSYVNTINQKHHRAILQGLENTDPKTDSEFTNINVIQGKYSGILGEHSYAHSSMRKSEANAQVVYQDHDYSFEN